MDLKLLTIVIVLLPLLGYLKLGIWGKRFFKGQSAGFLATSFIFLMTLASFYTAYRYFFVEGKVGNVYKAIVPFKIIWLEFSQGFSIDLGIVIDPISAMMLVVVSLVSLMVHLYSMGYMKGETRYATYFAHLCLFTFSMMGLVLSTNLFQIYMFWELVGVSSFLLIGFYFQKPTAVAASQKAFIVTRFADLGFLIGILCLSFYSKTFDIGTMVQTLTQPESAAYKAIVAGSFLGISALSWGLVLVFMGGAGKSAMFPLHIWLPDAMEGPTPVSALIHAATMVVAGVYLVARLFPLFSLSEPVLQLVTYIGAFSAFFAALIACTQTDIKRVLAYSTMSQIGYMMLSLGVAGVGEETSLGYTASLFHLFTHAMFKALLFLGAGSVIHYVHSNEMKDMGGLRKHMPITHITFLIACLAIAGVPFLAGFFSKEEILMAAYHKDALVFNIALITSGITAFYMFRLYFNIFWNRSGEHIHSDGHHGEGTWTMILPLIVLSLGAIFAGYIPFGEFVSVDGKPLHGHTDLAFSIIPVVLGIGGILIAMALYKKENNRSDKLAAAMGVGYRWAYRKFFIDEIYLFVTKKMLFQVIATSAAWVDQHIINGFVNKTGDTAIWVSEKIKGIQSGKVQAYGMYFLGGIVLLLVYFIYFMHSSF